MISVEGVPHSDLASVKIGGVEIVYDAFGEASKPPLLLIADLGAQMISWDAEFCTHLAARGYWLIRFDNRDVGFSTKIDEAGVPDIPALYQAVAQRSALWSPYTLQDMADDAVGLLDALAIESAHIVGLSMGGIIAQLVAIRHPERVRTLTCIMSTTGDRELPLPQPLALEALLKPSPTDRDGYVEHASQIAHVLSGPEFPPDEDNIRELAGQVFDRGLHPAGRARQLAAMLTTESTKDALQTVIAPTLVIHGDTDPLFPVQCGIAIARAIPGARIHIIQGMGHYMPPSAWQLMIEAVTGHAK